MYWPSTVGAGEETDGISRHTTGATKPLRMVGG
jgi:hypothetical protein